MTHPDREFYVFAPHPLWRRGSLLAAKDLRDRSPSGSLNSIVMTLFHFGTVPRLFNLTPVRPLGTT